MRRMLVPIFVAAVAALATAAPGSPATVTVQIRSTSFSPSSFTINHGDRVTWHNADKTDHQVVADDGSFASPILHPGQSYSRTLSTAGTFRFHDALHPRLTGKVVVKGPPPSLSLALSAPIVYWGTPITISGVVSTGAANQTVEISQQPYGQAAPSQLAVLKTGTGGAFSYTVTPSLYTTYAARWNNVSSGSVVAQVAPKMSLVPGGKGYMKAVVASPVSLWHKHVTLQRLSPYGQWVTVANLTLGEQNGRLFQPAAYLPRGRSVIRFFLPTTRAGAALPPPPGAPRALPRR